MKKLALFVAVLLSPLPSMQALAQAPQPLQQQHVCQDDAFRLCHAAIPDHQRIFVCLLENKRRLSAACRALIATSSAPQDDERGGGSRRHGARPN